MLASVVAAVLLLSLAFPALRGVARHPAGANPVVLAQSAPLADRPQYSGKQLVRPEDYREWIYLSSGIGMEYNATGSERENFTNVFVPAWAYREFVATGKWPEKSMIALEVRSSATKGSINRGGHFQTDIAGFSIEVKDTQQFKDTWAYFSFGKDAKTADPMTGPSDTCWQCHNDKGAVEHTFVQFYPTLKPIAQKFGVYRVTE
jgi:hypothetical protein